MANSESVIVSAFLAINIKIKLKECMPSSCTFAKLMKIMPNKCQSQRNKYKNDKSNPINICTQIESVKRENLFEMEKMKYKDNSRANIGQITLAATLHN